MDLCPSPLVHRVGVGGWGEGYQRQLISVLIVGRYVDHGSKVLLLYDDAAANDRDKDTFLLEEAPPGINLFALLNLRPPRNVTELDGWKVIFSKNSSSYNNISSILEVRFVLLYQSISNNFSL